MAKTNSIKILEVCRVAPFPNSPMSSTESSFPLTYFDLLWLKFHPNERIFFYELSQHESTRSFFNSVILPKLKHSLSLTLVHFLPVVGNIVWPVDAKKLCIIYSPNDTISFIVSKSNSVDDFNYLCRNEMLQATKLHPYVPELAISDSKTAIIAIQITFFPSQGFSIGMTMHHAVFDGKSIAMFMKVWAYICNENSKEIVSLPPDLTPLFDRTVINDPHGLDIVYLNKWSKFSPKSLQWMKLTTDFENLVRKTCCFSHQDIEKIRRKVVVSEKTRFSTFVVSCAYTLVCIVKAKTLDRKGKVGFVFSANCRSRLSPPIPANYFDNCVIASITVMNVEAITEENGVSFVASRLSEKIKGIESRAKNINIEQETKERLEFEKASKSVDMKIGVAGSPQFEIYGTDFGWGNPKKTEVVSIDKRGAISMVESNSKIGGVDIGIVLKKHEMEIFNSAFVNGLNHM